MKKQSIQFLFVALLLTACSGTNATAQPVSPTPVMPSFLLPMDGVILHSASYTIIAKNPARTLADLQKAVEQAGGYVSSASSYGGEGSGNYASLSAKVPPEALSALGDKIDKLADQVQNRNVYVQDVTAEILRLQQRHDDLARAQDDILSFLISQKDLDKVSSYGILHELLDNELKSVESQLASYQQQSKLASFDVTINQTASPVLPIE
jgi:hypothetical protein